MYFKHKTPIFLQNSVGSIPFFPTLSLGFSLTIISKNTKNRGQINQRRKYLTSSQINDLESTQLLLETRAEVSNCPHLQNSEAGTCPGLFHYLESCPGKIQIQLLKMTCKQIQKVWAILTGFLSPGRYGGSR